MLSFPIVGPEMPVSHVEQTLAALPQPLLVTMPDRRLVFTNACLERMFDTGQARRMADQLMNIGQLQGDNIENLLRQASAGHAVQMGLWFLPGPQTGWIDVSLARQDVARSNNWPPGSLLLLVHFDAPALTHGARIDALSQQCRLTATERYVLLLLADGLTVDAVARQLGLQVCTLRSHVRNLLGKTHAPTLMQLLRWMGSAAPLHG